VYSNSTDTVDPSSAVPPFDAIAPIVERIGTQLFAIILGLHTEWLSPAPPGTTVSGSVLKDTKRIFMAHPPFIVSVSLLGLNIIVALAYYIKRPKKMLRRMPTTVASILELFQGSTLVQEGKEHGRLSEDVTLAYGRFLGTDGKEHVGIERRAFVRRCGDT